MEINAQLRFLAALLQRKGAPYPLDRWVSPRPGMVNDDDDDDYNVNVNR
jgi:hypothetical protein